MMNVSDADARGMSLYDYEGRLHYWNKAHATGDDVEAPDPEKTQTLIDRINSNPKLFEGKAVKKEPMRAGPQPKA